MSRRRASRSNRSCGPLSSSTSRSRTSRARSTPSTCASSTSASRRGLCELSDSARVAEASASAIVTPARRSVTCLRVEPAPLLVILERVGELVELAGEDTVEVVDEQVDAVVLDAVLGVVVGADLLRALSGADLGEPACPDLGLLLGERALVQAGAEHAHRALAVL